MIPHYDNQEGGNHDTRFCYLGERRLAMLEPSLPDGVFVLGIDEHTGVIIDLDADTAEIVGKGAVTLRRHGVSMRIETGQTVPVDLLRAGPAPTPPTPRPARRCQTPRQGCLTPPHTQRPPNRQPAQMHRAPRPVPTAQAPPSTPSRGRSTIHEAAFDAALAARDADGAVAAILELESAIVEWSRDTLQSDDVDRARAALRSMIVRLGAAATEGVRDVREVLGPVVEAALAARVVARSEKAFAVSDAIRDELVKAGIEVRDTPDGVEWLIAES